MRPRKSNGGYGRFDRYDEIAFYSEGLVAPVRPVRLGGLDLVSNRSLSVNEGLACSVPGTPLPAGAGPASPTDQGMPGAGRPLRRVAEVTGGSTPADGLVGFAITLAFSGRRAVIGVLGQVDLDSAPELAAVLNAVIDRGHVDVVVDLAGTDFMGAAGLRVLATTGSRLRSLGGGLNIHSPSAMVGRMLDLTGLTKLVTPEAVGPVDQLGLEQTAAVPGSPAVIDPIGAGEQWRKVTALPADTGVVDGALRLVVALARVTASGADGVSLSLRSCGRLATVAAGDQTIEPAPGRRPASRCVEHGTPDGGAFGSKEQELASIFATEASLILRDAGVNVSEEQCSRRLGGVLRSRQVIAQAQGVVMERDGISEEAACTLLREFSRRSHWPLHDLAVDVVSSTRREAPWEEK